MLKLIFFMHLLASIGMGFYLLLPFLVQRLASSPAASTAGYAGVLSTANRVGQYMLGVAFLSGGYIISKVDYTYLWLTVVVVLFLGMAACSGIVGKHLKVFRDGREKDMQASIGRVRVFGVLTGVFFLLMVIIMKYPELLV